ncbi:MAG: F0F1 ATP synthase subunit delta [Puniceicoccales bacterium]|jgi:F0F1-type ATP synthase delta subunit|nr:F0F1 ATP synthase subunit delta [Puniceicoccales bacterium]
MKNHRSLLLVPELIKLSLGKDSLLDSERVCGIVTVLKEIYEGMELRSILWAYLANLEKFAAQTSMKIEHCGDISTSSVEALRYHFEKILKRKLSVSVKYTNDLIAGIRICIADLVIENSIAGVLSAYKKSIKSIGTK